MLTITHPVREITVGTGSWRMLVTGQQARLDPVHQEALLGMINAWLNTIPHRENTWVLRSHGVPTLFVRFDCVIAPDGTLRIYEIEERPQGMGSVSYYNSSFGERLAVVQRTWPDFVSVETPEHLSNGGTDDGDDGWVRQIPLSRLNEINPATLLLLRSEPYEREVWNLASRSVSTIRTEGSKQYGIDLGWWRIVSHPGELDWAKGFVLKPTQGSKSLDVVIWTPRRGKGSSTRSQVERALESGTMFCQPYHAPMEVEHEGRPYFMMLRPYFGYDIQRKCWMYLGGEWLVAPTRKLHGGGSTIFGALV